jgi:hypothetical protein
MFDPLVIEQPGDILNVNDEFERPEDRALRYAAVDWEGGSLQTGECERLSTDGKVRLNQ